MKRIGIFGGTFDPPHKGHLMIAKQATRQLRLEKVFFVPVYRAPHKSVPHKANAKDRWHMTRLAIGLNHRFVVSPVEIRRRGISYTIDTLRFFRRKYPSAKLYLIVGADNLGGFSSWKAPRNILELATLVVYPRRGSGPVPLIRKAMAVRLQGPVVDISSSDIRRLAQARKSLQRFVPQSVGRYIRSKGLYA